MIKVIIIFLVESWKQVKITDFGLAKLLDFDKNSFQLPGGRSKVTIRYSVFHQNPFVVIIKTSFSSFIHIFKIKNELPAVVLSKSNLF